MTSCCSVACLVCRAILQYVDQRYGHPDIIVTENGVDVPGESNIPYPELLNDTFRINYIQSYLDQVSTRCMLLYVRCHEWLQVGEVSSQG